MQPKHLVITLTWFTRTSVLMNKWRLGYLPIFEGSEKVVLIVPGSRILVPSSRTYNRVCLPELGICSRVGSMERVPNART